MQPISLLPKERCSPRDRTCFFLNRNNKKAAFSSQLKKRNMAFSGGNPHQSERRLRRPRQWFAASSIAKPKQKAKTKPTCVGVVERKLAAFGLSFFSLLKKKQFCLWTFSFQKLFAPCKTAKYGKRPWQSCAWRYLSSKNRKKDPFCVRRSSVEMERTWRLLLPLSKSLADGFVTVSFLLLLASEFVTLKWMNTNDVWQGFLWGV